MVYTDSAGLLRPFIWSSFSGLSIPATHWSTERFGRPDDGGDADVSSSAWLRTTLLGVVIHMCRRHAAPTQAQVRLR